MMKNVKILHMLPRLLSLYGEYGNVRVLEKYAPGAEVDCWEGGELTLSGYDLVYIGSGTEDNLLEAVKRLAPYRDAIASSVAAGTHWLATGNAMTLFGSEILRGGEKTAALGIFGYETEIAAGKRYLGDVLTEPAFGAPLVGFVNTSCIYKGIEAPLLELKLNPNLGNDKQSAADGIREQNFYGTQLIGPVLVKNPHFLAQLAGELTGETPVIAPEENIVRAYRVAVDELTKRL